MYVSLHLSLLKRFPLFIWASVCWSLQCLISALTQMGRGSLLFRFACSVVLRGGRGTADKYPWPVWGALAVFWPQWVFPCSGVCAQTPGCSIWSGPCIVCGSSFCVFHKSTDSVGPVFCAFPGWRSSGSQELDWRTLPRCSEPYPLRGPSISFRVFAPQSGACACDCSQELASSCDPPGGQIGSLFAVW